MGDMVEAVATRCRTLIGALDYLMSRLFISHSSRDNIAALAVQNWLVADGWSPPKRARPNRCSPDSRLVTTSSTIAATATTPRPTGTSLQPKPV